jgi:hypothetical protein
MIACIVRLKAQWNDVPPGEVIGMTEWQAWSLVQAGTADYVLAEGETAPTQAPPKPAWAVG